MNANAVECSQSTNILWGTINSLIGAIPEIGSAAVGFDIISNAAQEFTCDGGSPGYVTKEVVEDMFYQFGRDLKDEKIAELESNVRVLVEYIETADNIPKLDSTIRDAGYVEADAESVGFEAIHITTAVAALKLNMLIQKYFLTMELNDNKKIERAKKDFNSYMSGTLERLKTQEDDLEKYLNEKIFKKDEYESFTIPGDLINPTKIVKSWKYYVINDVTGEMKQSGWERCTYVATTNCSSDISFNADQWVSDQKKNHRSEVKTKDYLKTKKIFEKYAYQDIESIYPIDLNAFDPNNKKTTKIINGAIKGSIYIADFDGDGKNDIFSAKDKKWHLKSGSSETWKIINSSGVSFKDLAFGDFDEDGKTDVFFADGKNWKVSYGGKSAWKTINSSGVKTRDLFVGDFDGDDKADVFFADGKNWKVSWTGKKSWKTINSSGAKTRDLLFGDFDNNGKIDVFHSSAGKWNVSYDGKSSWTTINTAGEKNKDLLVGDFDGDGYADVLMANSSIWKISYGGNGSWKTVKSNMEARKSDVFLGDYDNDGVTEILW